MSMPQKLRLVLAMVDIAGFGNACRGRSEVEIFAMLDSFYNQVNNIIARADGVLVKGMGDGVLLVFPEARAAAAVECLQELETEIQSVWKDFNASCRVRVHAHLGTVAAGPLGPDQRFDVVGPAVNDLFKMPWGGPKSSTALGQFLTA